MWVYAVTETEGVTKETVYCPNGAQHGGDWVNAFLDGVNLFSPQIWAVIKPCHLDSSSPISSL